MLIAFRKLSDRRHSVMVERDDRSTEIVELDSKDFLRHDLAHFAVEIELDLADGVWGSVARGGSLAGQGLDGPDMDLAERLAGPVQTLMRLAAPATDVHRLLEVIVPDLASADLAERLHERMRSLTGHWNATPYGEAMVLSWPPETDSSSRPR